MPNDFRIRRDDPAAAAAQSAPAEAEQSAQEATTGQLPQGVPTNQYIVTTVTRELRNFLRRIPQGFLSLFHNTYKIASGQVSYENFGNTALNYLGVLKNADPPQIRYTADNILTGYSLFLSALDIHPTPVEEKVSKIGLFEIADPALADQVDADIAAIREKIPIFRRGFRVELESLAERIRTGQRIPTYVLSNTGMSEANALSLFGGVSYRGDFPFHFSTLWEYVDGLPAALKTYAVGRRCPNFSLEIHLSLPTFLRWAAQNTEAFESAVNYFYIRKEFLRPFVQFAMDNGAVRVIALPETSYWNIRYILNNRAMRMGVEMRVAGGPAFETVNADGVDKDWVDDVVNRWSESVLDPQGDEKYHMVGEAQAMVRELRRQGLSAAEIIDVLKTTFDIPLREAKSLFHLSQVEISGLDHLMSLYAKDIAEDRPYGDRHGGHSIFDLDGRTKPRTILSRTAPPYDPPVTSGHLSGRGPIFNGQAIPPDFKGEVECGGDAYRVEDGRVEVTPMSGRLVNVPSGRQVGIFYRTPAPDSRLFFRPATAKFEDLRSTPALGAPDVSSSQPSPAPSKALMYLTSTSQDSTTSLDISDGVTRTFMLEPGGKAQFIHGDKRIVVERSADGRDIVARPEDGSGKPVPITTSPTNPFEGQITLKRQKTFGGLIDVTFSGVAAPVIVDEPARSGGGEGSGSAPSAPAGTPTSSGTSSSSSGAAPRSVITGYRQSSEAGAPSAAVPAWIASAQTYMSSVYVPSLIMSPAASTALQPSAAGLALCSPLALRPPPVAAGL